jgi:hypothetical protein
VTLLLINALAADSIQTNPAGPIDIDRTWEVLTAEDDRARMLQASELLGDWSVEVAGVALDGARLHEIATTAPDEPFTRVVREATARPVDVPDLMYFLDDVLVAEDRRGQDICVTSGRARSAGILLHPDDIFKNKPKVYGAKSTLAVDRPQAPESYPPADDGEVLGPRWSARYANPTEFDDHLAGLDEARPKSGFADRVRSLLDQLIAQGSEVYITSAVRSRHRGYLMWGAFVLSRQTTKAGVDQSLTTLNNANTEWKLNTPISWSHPDGWEATVENARLMADAYGVVYATESGARWSKHYSGVACDFIALGLPRSLTLDAPDGVSNTFDLSDAEESRDLSLSPALISWVEKHFSFSKLKSDYPHWNDAT